MNHYIISNPVPLRPAMKDVISGKLKAKFPNAYKEEPDTIKTMLAHLKSQNSTSTTAGLWPLDVCSCFDWRDASRLNKTTMGEFVTMAKVEIALIGSYRSDLLKNCPEAAFIRRHVANELADACVARATVLPHGDTRMRNNRPIRIFTYADKISLGSTSGYQRPVVNVTSLRAGRQAVARSDAMTREAITMFKRLESMQGLSASPDSKLINPKLSQMITDLQSEVSWNIGRLVKMKTALEADKNETMDPRLQKYQPTLKELPQLDFPRRLSYPYPIVRQPPTQNEPSDGSNNNAGKQGGTAPLSLSSSSSSSPSSSPKQQSAEPEIGEKTRFQPPVPDIAMDETLPASSLAQLMDIDTREASMSQTVALGHMLAEVGIGEPGLSQPVGELTVLIFRSINL
jgi:hypothetical protein